MVNDEFLNRLRAHPPGEPICWLDGVSRGWSALFQKPVAVYRSRGGHGTLEEAGGNSRAVDGNPFRFLSHYLAEHPDQTAAGYWSYDLRYHLEHLPHRAQDDLGLPDCWVGLFPEGSVTRAGARGAAPSAPTSEPPELRDSMPREEYERAVGRVLEYIAAGDCYQVNLSHRLSAPLAEAPAALYERLRAISPVPYGAYLDCGDHQVLSASPELFLRVRDGKVETHPIKGTRPRGATAEEDAARAAELLSSAKDRAELLMIVDLERNDLGRVCGSGTVRVPDLFRLESFSNVHHLVATVTGQLRKDVGPLECLAACFPGGSITGAPKIRAMEIIEELEPVRRGVYTGAIGWVDGRGNAEWNIAIRTMVVKEETVYFSVGGGIVADSLPAAEYEETLTKARSMREALRRPEPDGSEGS